MKTISKLVIFALLLGLFASCIKKEEQQMSDLDKLRNSNNKITYPAVQMDSAQAINSITKQKIEQLLELSTLYLSGNKNTEIDTLILSQMKNYFQTPDSLALTQLLSELDSMKVKRIKVNNVEVYKEVKNEDTLDLAKFNVEYFDQKNKSMGRFEKNAQYTLISKPVKFKKEFQFYFVKFYHNPLKNDSTSVGVTK
ncbi:hypothetical protein CHRY9390_01109 [Chryseobacterium aquaeductus]|uniref:Lipoprotein n=1 Tax=Chryseobacterium aquaeductus TaxID=2675056 RepID=A0A9N8MGU9_9FLAO|nr:hypothetical protein [Chryseobacterium aquaeductus]CAA7330441.1 hypothetical protein CHRY9390_01109 [Chryseobacterium potabilaquae]CAD7803658.1 hypothetical protein CHRY9390_01109 [Chryseobacterium aquaeductus]